MKHHLYVDGGVVLKNPSPHGGTYAWVLVREDSAGHQELFREGWGMVYPNDTFPLITNNFTEMLALKMGLDFLWDTIRRGVYTGPNPHIHSDSQITLERAFGSFPWAGIPIPVKDRVESLVAVLRHRGQLDYTLIAGHPNKKELEAGYKIKKNGARYPVSRWNVHCDQKCAMQSRMFVEQKGEL